jgi:hypothetical protein
MTTCPVCGPLVPGQAKKGKKKRRARQEAATWSAVAAAVAVVTNERTRSGASLAGLLGDNTPEEVIRAQGIILGAVLEVLAPDDATRVLRHLGLAALERSTRLRPSGLLFRAAAPSTYAGPGGAAGTSCQPPRQFGAATSPACRP